MRTKSHLCMDIEGFLKHGGQKACNHLFKDDAGNFIPGKTAKDMLRLELAKGKRYMLLGDPRDCPDFDPYHKCCPGHVLPDEET